MTLLLFANLCYAATIHGTIYDFNLDPLDDVVITVNSTPTQRFIAKNGTYSFELSPGSYLLEASHSSEGINYYAEENILISKEGSYVIDLFLLPDLSEEEELLNESETIITEDIEEEKISYTPHIIISVVLVIVIIILFVLLKLKEKKKPAEELTSDIEKVIKIIKQAGGRITQKELRKQMPLSEAKISLLITELEDKDIIKKIKKGRGNILILK
ncbi:hypothetical protein KY339_04170 [Candidatus Woesearchaeota archaeon]|nr:hypothetical protein [Candidatus Woesearchaeota archaeon]